jgi:hypothetical protein
LFILPSFLGLISIGVHLAVGPAELQEVYLCPSLKVGDLERSEVVSFEGELAGGPSVNRNALDGLNTAL